MSLKFERLVAFGPVVDYNAKKTWTPEVEKLYERLKDGDDKALAPLLAIDLEFIRDLYALGALLRLKYDPDYPGQKARRELRKIANILTRRPARRGRLPHGDLLYVEIGSLAVWLKAHGFLKYKKDPAELERRLRETLTRQSRVRAALPDGVVSLEAGWIDEGGRFVPSLDRGDDTIGIKSDEELDKICEALVEGVRTSTGHVRTERSWALQTIAILYNADLKMIQKRMARDPLVRAMKTLGQPTAIRTT